ncbi:hypothetical protein K491DRAFT_690680 [Lophiostoma macrostomum CBS 122681]|uniref:Uncharacterized protein n=1 Tax=Lophiostoma macrostomum CBS 122681 TaxID=1314788 RepID=A0A6A6TE24_9PLEO|nr:hypothetical protein K491DRAFT_690680 [Lophiostoma macrostomum CBS 122681]
MSDVLPVYLRLPMELVKAIRARPVEVAGWIALHAAVVVGVESHGRFLEDKSVVEQFCTQDFTWLVTGGVIAIDFRTGRVCQVCRGPESAEDVVERDGG